MAEIEPQDGAELLLSNDPVVAEAKRRWDLVCEWESSSRERFINDIKFAEADSDNAYQWPNAIRRARDVDQKPCLTMNITRQHNLQIINEGKQSKSGIKVRATGGGASVDSAKVAQQIIRHIEYNSKAAAAYSVARSWQVKGGIGWWRLKTDYAGPDTFDQEIYIEAILDPLSVYCDPDCKQPDKSDMRYAFVYAIMAKDEFRENYPQYAEKARLSPLGANTSGDNDLLAADHVRICEYYRKTREEDLAISFIDPATHGRKTARRSLLPKEVVSALLDDPLTRTRAVWNEKIEWYLIAGEEVIDSTDWPGKYIPLIPVIGEETIIDGQLDRKGHTRAMKDAQRMFNYSASGQVEFVSMQGKTPWIAPVAAIEELETYWNSANTENHSVLPYKHVDEDGTPIPAPTKPPPPSASPGLQTGMETAFNQMMMTSGQWQNQMGMMGNERTGEAISRRQEQGDKATYHFHDNFRDAIVNCGRQILDLIPKVYDTKRLMLIQSEEEDDIELEIDPSARQAYLEKLGQDQKVVKRIFNPGIGEYDVQADMGPAYGTKRQETVDAMTLILTQAPNLTPIIGDLLLGSMEFEKGIEAAQRLKRMVPPQALGQGPSQQEQVLGQQVQALQASLTKALQITAKDQLKLVGKDEMRDIDVYEAETKRLAAMKDVLMSSPELVQHLLTQLGIDTSGVDLEGVVKANSETLQEASVPSGSGGNALQAKGTPPTQGGQ